MNQSINAAVFEISTDLLRRRTLVPLKNELKSQQLNLLKITLSLLEDECVSEHVCGGFKNVCRCVYIISCVV